ncbi:uncharacterized protein V6R79_005549 [Siganus canaliculatus]
METDASEEAPDPVKQSGERTNSDSEGYLSDCSEISQSQLSASQERKLYPEKMFKLFLQQTKGVKKP